MTAIFQRRSSSRDGSSPGSSIRWTMSSSAMGLVHHCLYRGRIPGRDPWDGDAEAGAPAEPRFERHAATQLLGDEVEDDVQAEPGAALVAAGGEEGIEGATLGLLAHADAVVGDEDVDVVAHLPRLDDDAAGAAIGKGVDHAIEEQIGEHLPV